MSQGLLVERVVRNDHVYCSLLFDRQSNTLRVVDFFGGNFGIKQRYLESVRSTEGVRKVFTLIEHSEVAGWRQVGFHREGTVPGYYKRSDAHIMSRIYDDGFENGPDKSELKRREELLAQVTAAGEGLAALRPGPIRSELADRSEALAAIKAELTRLRTKPAAGTALRPRPAPRGGAPLFGPFGRNAERYYWIADHRRTRERNVYGVEYQGCFGNAKIDMYFTPTTRAGRSLACLGLRDFVDWLVGIGAVAVFALVRADDPAQNAIYAAAGFKNGGWLRRQLVRNGDPVDQVLWTRKSTDLIGWQPTAR